MEGVPALVHPTKVIFPWSGSLEKCINSHTCSCTILGAGILSLLWVVYFLSAGSSQRRVISNKTPMEASSQVFGGAHSDGEVVVSKILIHPIKVRFTILYFVGIRISLSPVMISIELQGHTCWESQIHPCWTRGTRHTFISYATCDPANIC